MESRMVFSWLKCFLWESVSGSEPTKIVVEVIGKYQKDDNILEVQPNIKIIVPHFVLLKFPTENIVFGEDLFV